VHHRDGRWAHHDARAHHDAPLQCGHAFVGVETEGYSEERANWLMKEVKARAALPIEMFI
jgi:hypothetical protein